MTYLKTGKGMMNNSHENKQQCDGHKAEEVLHEPDKLPRVKLPAEEVEGEANRRHSCFADSGQ